jgi:hypothetical protein
MGVDWVPFLKSKGITFRPTSISVGAMRQEHGIDKPDITG